MIRYVCIVTRLIKYKQLLLKSTAVKKDFFNKISKTIYINIFWASIKLLFVDFLSFFLKRRILFFFKKPTNCLHSSSFLRIFRKIRYPYGLKLNKIDYINIIYYALLLKDSSLFLNYSVFFFESNRIKSHKKIFFLIKSLILRFSLFFRRLGVKGFFLDLKGKIGLTGNAKKKRLFFRCRRHSLTRKWLRVSFNNSIVRTTTGVLGISTYIFF